MESKRKESYVDFDSRVENSLLSYDQAKYSEIADLEEKLRSAEDEI